MDFEGFQRRLKAPSIKTKTPSKTVELEGRGKPSKTINFNIVLTAGGTWEQDFWEEISEFRRDGKQ